MADELAEIDGVKPNKILRDGEEETDKSMTSKAVYKIKRRDDHYYCNCPAWRNQKAMPVSARTCKHLISVLGKKYEDARLASKNPEGKGKAKPTSKTKAAPVKRKKPADEEDEDEEQKPLAPKPRSKRGAKVEEPEEDEPPPKRPAKRQKKEREEEPDAIDVDQPASSSEKPEIIKAATDVEDDVLMCINGVRPKRVLKDGEDLEIKSQTSSSTYKVKRTWDHYYCTCPAWRNNKSPVNARSCKHLMALLGDKYEAERIKFKDPDGPQPSSPKKKALAKRKKVVKEDGDEQDDEDDENDKPISKKQPDLLLANKWDLEKGIDPTDWWCSEKLDGVRVYYDGKKMISRLGNAFTPPQWFLDKLPNDVTLDGELFGGRGEFQSTVSIVRTIGSPHWQNITFEIFDIPSKADEPFEARIKYLQDTFGKGGSKEQEQIHVVTHESIRDRDHVFEELKKVESKGGEGLMLRKPKSQVVTSLRYMNVAKRPRHLAYMRVKTFYDAEAIVMGYTDGAGKNKGVTGALKCKMASGKTFNVGTGLSDKQRTNPPAIGSIICYRFQELTRDEVPRFPSFLGEAADKTEPKDAEIRAADDKDD